MTLVGKHPNINNYRWWKKCGYPPGMYKTRSRMASTTYELVSRISSISSIADNCLMTSNSNSQRAFSPTFPHSPSIPSFSNRCFTHQGSSDPLMIHSSTPQKSTPRRDLLPQWSCLPMEVHPPNCQASQILPDLLPGFLRSKMVMDLLFIGALPTINWRLWCVSRNFSNFCGLMKWSMMNYTCIYRIWGKCSSLLLETSLRSTVSKGPCFCELLVVKVGWRFTIIVGNPIWKALSFLSPPRIL